MKEIEEYQESIRKEIAAKFKLSKQVLELRAKEAALVKLKMYAEAEKVKAQVDVMEEWEKAQSDAEIQEAIEKKLNLIRQKQSLAMNALLKRIERDRLQQLRNRQTDSNRLLTKNKNLRVELLARHNLEAKKIMENIRGDISLYLATATGTRELMKSKIYASNHSAAPRKTRDNSVTLDTSFNLNQVKGE
eukprot:TRINITY_DN1519_c0_g1_i4.p3 TRINITY_DN1519_c0_g1~~TRINITY_DN1519_c0_g1_i4.p3  ORF type:complete len:190 (-),score=46.13 TRINITY_DN1519_c0_g1_i4:446-1015(-)